MDVEGRIVLITGGAGGIGKALAARADPRRILVYFQGFAY